MNAAQNFDKQTPLLGGVTNALMDELESEERSALSALVDSELKATELDAFFQAMQEAPGARPAWHGYHVIGEALRGSSHGASAVPPNVFLAGIQARLLAEPPVKVQPVAPTTVLHVRAPAANDAEFRWKLVAGVASLAAVMAVSWSVLGSASPGDHVSAPQLALSPPVLAPSVANTATGAVLVNTEQGTVIRDARLEQLLAEHRQYGGMSALQMPAGFLRDATSDAALGDDAAMKFAFAFYAASASNWLFSRAEPRWARELRSVLAFAAVVSMLLQPAFAQVTVQAPTRSVNEWLTRMHEASRQRAYMGTLVVSTGSAMSASRIWHICDGTQQMERVETLTGAPRTTIRRNNDVITFVPEAKVAWVEKRESLGLFPELLRTPSNQIPEFYGARENGAERVAGHLADVVDITPKDALRFGYRIWAEKKTGLVVKMQTLGEHGTVLEQVAFSELQLDAPVRMDKLKQLMGDTKGYELHKPVLRKTTAEVEGWRLKDVVPGFLPMSCHTRESETAGSGAPPMQWVFSDGLASVSLFVEPYDAARHTQEKAAVMGATHSLSRRVGGHWVTVMGEVPPSTLRRFAGGLERTR